MNPPTPDEQVPHLRQLREEQSTVDLSSPGIYTLGESIAIIDEFPKTKAELDDIKRRASAAEDEAQFRLALFFIYNSDQTIGLRNPGLAAKLLSSLAEKGHPGAAFNLGLLHEFGKGVAKDENLAASLYEAAARKGHLYAMFHVGNIYLNSSNALFNPEKGKMWIYAAARGGVSLACEIVATQLSQTAIERITWLESAANKRLTSAQVKLGEAHEAQAQDRKNLIRAIFWYSLAKKLGTRHLEDKISTLSSRLSHQELISIEIDVSSWVVIHPVKPLPIMLP